MLRSLLVMICLVSASCQTARVPPPPVSPIVLIEIYGEHDKILTTSTGFVRTDGSVVAPLQGLRDVERVSIRTSNGQRHPSEGITAYHSDAGVALFAVQWGGPPPPGLEVASRYTTGERLSLVAFYEDSAEHPPPIEIVPDPLFFPLFIGASWPGGRRKDGYAVAINSAGCAAGLVKGAPFAVGVAFELPDPKITVGDVLDCVRPEVIGALQRGESISWSSWRNDILPKVERAKALVSSITPKLRSENPERSLVASRKATQLDERSWYGWAYLGWAYGSSSQWEAAQEAYLHAVALTPTDTTSLGMRGWALSRLGRTEEARSEVARAIAIDPGDARLWEMRGRILYAAKLFDESADSYLEALRLNPKSEEAKRVLDALAGYGTRAKLQLDLGKP